MDYIYINAEVYKSDYIAYVVFKSRNVAIANAKRWTRRPSNLAKKLEKIITYRVKGLNCIGWNVNIELSTDFQHNWELINTEVSEL